MLRDTIFNATVSRVRTDTIFRHFFFNNFTMKVVFLIDANVRVGHHENRKNMSTPRKQKANNYSLCTN